MRLTDYLAQQNVTPAEFARRIGTTRQAIGRYMRGERMPEVNILRAIKAESGGVVTADDFVDDVTNATPAVERHPHEAA